MHPTNPQDSYACDIFSLLAREREMSQYVCSYISLQRDHFQRALDTLDLVLPDVQTQLQASLLSPMYGVPLHDHLKIAQQVCSGEMVAVLGVVDVVIEVVVRFGHHKCRPQHQFIFCCFLGYHNIYFFI